MLLAFAAEFASFGRESFLPQGGERFEVHSAAGRHVASNRRGGEQQAEAGCARDWVDSSGKQDSGRQSSAGEGTWRSYGSSGERQKKGLAQNQPQDPVGPRAQGHANPDFARSPADHAGHESNRPMPVKTRAAAAKNAESNAVARAWSIPSVSGTIVIESLEAEMAMLHAPRRRTVSTRYSGASEKDGQERLAVVGGREVGGRNSYRFLRTGDHGGREVLSVSTMTK